jgi:hydrogenase maturation protease
VPVTGPRAVLIGVGNPYRRDDGIGPAVVAAIGKLHLPGIVLTVSDGEPSQLLDAWAGADLAVLVDAVLCDPATPGRIHRTSPGAAAGSTAASTHGLGVPDAIRLAEALDRVPRRLVVLAVEAADLSFGAGLSPAVAACLPELTRAVQIELATVPPGVPADVSPGHGRGARNAGRPSRAELR